MDLNSVNLSGRLTGDPQGKRTSEGRSVTWFRIAVHRDPDHPDFFRIVCFDRLADTVLRYLHKSSRVIIEGRLAQRERDGQSQVEIVATDIHFLESVKARDSRDSRGRDTQDTTGRRGHDGQATDEAGEVLANGANGEPGREVEEIDPYNRRDI